MKTKTWIRVLVELLVTNNMWWLFGMTDKTMTISGLVFLASLFCSIWTICDLFYVAGEEMGPEVYDA